MAARTVPIKTKILYGAGEVAVSAKNTVLNQFLLFFYADLVYLQPALVSVAIFLAKLWDAIIDPLTGYLSDTTHSRWGRRRPFVVASSLPLGLFFFLLFWPPEGSTRVVFGYLLLTYSMLNTCFAAFTIPYVAWGAELTHDYHERTTVVQIRSLFGVLGGIIGSAAPVAIAGTIDEPRMGYAVMALFIGVVLSVSGLVTGLGVSEGPSPKRADASLSHFLTGLHATFANRDFRIIFITFCMMTLASALGEAVRLIVIKYWLQMYDFFPILALTFAVFFAGSFPLWFGLSRRVGKRTAMLTGLLAGAIVPFGWVIVQPGERAAMLVFMMAAGIASGSITIVISSAIDVIDFDELQTGERREGAYFGIWTLGLKVSSACGILLSGLLLQVVGYVPGAEQSADTLWWLVMIVGPMQSAAALVGFVILRRFRFDAADVEYVQAELLKRRTR